MRGNMSSDTMWSAARACRARVTQRRPLAMNVAILLFLFVPAWLLLVDQEMMALNYQPEAVKKHMLRTPPRRTNTTAVLRQDVKKLMLLGDQIMQQEHGDFFPEDIYAVDWSQHVPRSDVLHMGAIQRACVAHPESAISWTFGRNGDTDPSGESLVNRTVDGHADNNERLLEALRKCPDVDVFVPVGIRGQGYCEDAAAYTKYLHGRIVSRWIFEIRLFDKTLNREVSYHELCPSTPMVFLQHYWDGLRDEPDWPATKPLYVMPNIEMSELQPRHLMQADVVLCKTAVCAQYIAMWFEQEGNPRMAQVLYTRFTSSDMATNALAAAGLESLESNWQVRATKDFKTPMFVHTAGGSSEKGSRWILDCWLSRPDLPQLDFYMGEALYNQYYKKRYEERILKTTNIKVHVSSIDAVTFGRMIADTAFFLCTSYMEGYGHYINHARAAGGLIITPDVPPMNELISSTSGVLLDAKRSYLKRLFLGGDSDDPKGLRNVPGFTALFDGKEICQAVDHVLQELSASDRQRRAMRARQNFFYDTAVFAMKMRELHTMLRPAAPTA